MDTQKEIKRILEMIDERVTNEYKVDGYGDNILYLHSRTTGNDFVIHVDELEP